MQTWVNKYTGRSIRLHFRNPDGLRVVDIFDKTETKLIETVTLRKGEQLRSRMAYLGYTKV